MPFYADVAGSGHVHINAFAFSLFIEVGETMESVVLRYHGTGMSIKEISDKTSMPEEFVERVISPSKFSYDELKQVGVDYADKKKVEEYDSGMQNLSDIS